MSAVEALAVLAVGRIHGMAAALESYLDAEQEGLITIDDIEAEVDKSMRTDDNGKVFEVVFSAYLRDALKTRDRLADPDDSGRFTPEDNVRPSQVRALLTRYNEGRKK